jgi:hypothetical protein
MHEMREGETEQHPTECMKDVLPSPKPNIMPVRTAVPHEWIDHRLQTKGNSYLQCLLLASDFNEMQGFRVQGKAQIF